MLSVRYVIGSYFSYYIVVFSYRCLENSSAVEMTKAEKCRDEHPEAVKASVSRTKNHQGREECVASTAKSQLDPLPTVGDMMQLMLTYKAYHGMNRRQQ